MIELYTAATPNGFKATILLEELGLPYTVHHINIMKGEQFDPKFTKINPNAKIPAIVDTENDVTVFESTALMIYLAEKAGQLYPKEFLARTEVLQWLMFQTGNLGPMMGQANVFIHMFPEKIPSVIERYQTESNRLLGVLNERLAEHEYLAGEYSIADIANWSWARIYAMPALELEDKPHLRRWLDAIGKREAVAKAIKIPMTMEELIASLSGR